MSFTRCKRLSSLINLTILRARCFIDGYLKDILKAVRRVTFESAVLLTGMNR